MRLLFLLWLFCFGFSSCSGKTDPIDEGLDQVILVTRAEIKRKYNAEVSAIGFGAMNGIYSLTMCFSLEKNMDISEARKIVLSTTETLLKNINSNILLRPYLVEYPFSPYGIVLSFLILDGTLDPIYIPGNLKKVTLQDGMIEYFTSSKKGKFVPGDRDVVMSKETLQEAQNKVVYEKNS